MAELLKLLLTITILLCIFLYLLINLLFIKFNKYYNNCMLLLSVWQIGVAVCGDQSPALLQPSPGRGTGRVCPCPGVQPGSGCSQTQLGVLTVARMTRLSCSLHQQLLCSPRTFYTNAAFSFECPFNNGQFWMNWVREKWGGFCQILQHLFNFSSRVNLQSSTVVRALKLCIIHRPPFDRQDRLLASPFFFPNFSFF